MLVCFLVLLFIMGACFGSFLCCEARRFHYRLTAGKHRRLPARSICLHCHHQLAWYDNLPLFSWIFLKGKCRHCGKRYGLAEFLAEFGLALIWLCLGLAFLLSKISLDSPSFASFTGTQLSLFSPLEWLIFLSTLLLTLPLAFLALYDAFYRELPTFALIIALILSVITMILKEIAFATSLGLLPSTAFTAGLASYSASSLVTPLSIFASSPHQPFELIIFPLFSFLLLGGVYLLLYLISHGRWVGDGDWLLASSLAFALVTPWHALLTLFLANLLASLIMYPMLRKSRTSTLPLGPFLVIAFFLVLIISQLVQP